MKKKSLQTEFFCDLNYFIMAWANDNNIVLNKDSKALLISDSTFGNTGIQLQHNSGTPRAHIGKSNGERWRERESV